MREEELIKLVAGKFPRSSKQHNATFESDCELIEIGGEIWGINLDEFSKEEDNFGELDAETLGNNLAVGVLSDLFAGGCKPMFYMHSMTIERAAEKSEIDKLTNGISKVLEKLDCYLLGGDMSIADNWRYTAMAMGPALGRTVTRKIPEGRYELWVSGQLGDANYAALNNMPAPLFELRATEAKCIREMATGAIDTSGGLYESLWQLKTVNRQSRISIDIDSLPLDQEGVHFCRRYGIPPVGLCFGGAGEYELLFTTEADSKPYGEVTKIGEVLTGSRCEGGLFFNCGGSELEIHDPPVCARAFSSRQEYIQKVMEQIANVLG